MAGEFRSERAPFAINTMVLPPGHPLWVSSPPGLGKTGQASPQDAGIRGDA